MSNNDVDEKDSLCSLFFCFGVTRFEKRILAGLSFLYIFTQCCFVLNDINSFMRKFGELCAALTIMFAVGGCSASKDLTSQAVSLNKAVEEAENKLLLLNIVRACKSSPMYFTGFTKLSGRAGISEETITLDISLEPDDNVLSPALTVNPGIDYEIGILQKQDFMRGILHPVAPETVKLYWDQGWPKQLLFHLFIEKIVLLERKKGKAVITDKFVNDPDPVDRKAFEKFAKEVGRLVNDYDWGLFYGDRRGTKGSDGKEREVLFNAKPMGPEAGSYIVNNKYRLTMPHRTASKEKRNGEDGRFALVYLRSPQSIIYYLGKIVKAQTEGMLQEGERVWPLVGGDEKKGPIIYVEKARSNSHGDALVDVKYDDVTYLIPRNIPGENAYNSISMKTLALVMQIIGQYKSSDDLPASSTFRLIGN